MDFKERPIYYAECWLNYTLLYLLMKVHLGVQRKPSHCSGMTECLRTAKRVIEKYSSNNSTKILLIDQEEAEEHRIMLSSFINKFKCSNSCNKKSNKNYNKYIRIYKCDGGLIIITLKGPPEDAILPNLDPEIKSALKNPDSKKKFKQSKLRRSVGLIESMLLREGFDCRGFSDVVYRGLCLLYKEIERVVSGCIG
ncbi:MAG: hypothetical protein GSR84_05635 [Desulfurococcales archaeon]|nr:hypothetical protein [Desulfurococcales archaeon]